MLQKIYFHLRNLYYNWLVFSHEFSFHHKQYSHRKFLYRLIYTND
uniref:Uncharacterized protein n=1 Tax=Schistosoma curassoni TaxID=6186 RepID=A0A183JMS6_9TREM